MLDTIVERVLEKLSDLFTPHSKGFRIVVHNAMMDEEAFVGSLIKFNGKEAIIDRYEIRSDGIHIFVEYLHGGYDWIGPDQIIRVIER